jgi:hypothetical protein
MKIDFSFETQYGKFADAIVLPDNHNLSDEAIDALKQQRLDNWIAVVTYVPTEEELAEIEKQNAYESVIDFTEENSGE